MSRRGTSACCRLRDLRRRPIRRRTRTQGPDADLDHLKRKLDAGATRAITHSFCPDCYLRFRDACARRGIGATIVPGVLPITRFPQLLKFAARCGASVPDWLVERFEGLDDDPETRKMISASVAIEQVARLRREGVEEFHFYTLNRAELVYAICHVLGSGSGVAAGGRRASRRSRRLGSASGTPGRWAR